MREILVTNSVALRQLPRRDRLLIQNTSKVNSTINYLQLKIALHQAI